MTLDLIAETAKEMIPDRIVQRSNLKGDFDVFDIDIVKKSKGIPKGYVHITTNIGFARYGQWTRFDIKIPNGSPKEYVLSVLKGVQDYYNECINKEFSTEYSMYS